MTVHNKTFRQICGDKEKNERGETCSSSCGGPEQRSAFSSSVHFPEGALWWSVLFRESLQLEGVESVFAAAYVFHGVFSPAALAVEKKR